MAYIYTQREGKGERSRKNKAYDQNLREATTYFRSENDLLMLRASD